MNGLGFSVLLLYVFCVLWRPQDYLTFMLEQPILFGLQMLVLVFWLFGRKTFDAPQYKFILGLLFTVSVSCVLTLGVRLGWQKTQDFFLLQVLMFILVANALTTLKRQQQFFVAFMLGTLVMALHTIDQYFDPARTGWTGIPMLARNDFSETLWQPRYVGIFNDPNDLGMALAISLPFIAYLFTQVTNVLTKTSLAAVFIVHLIAIYLTNSRGTMVSVAAMAGVWGILRYGGFKLLLRLLFIAPLLPIIVPSRFYLSGDGSSEGRINAWYEGTQMFLASPIFGIGQGNFMDYHVRTAHNSWVLVFAELGFVGYYFWVALMFSSLYILWVCQQPFHETSLASHLEQAYNRERLIASATMYSMIGALTCAFFLSRSYIIVLYFLPALAVAQYHRFRMKFDAVQFRPIALHMLWLSVGFFALINIVIRINT